MKSNIILNSGCCSKVSLWPVDGKVKTWDVTLTRALQLVDLRNKSIDDFHEFLKARIKSEL